MPIFTVFFEHHPNLPPNRPFKKTITLHNGKTECFGNGLLWELRTFMLTKTHNWKNERNNNKKKGIWKTKQNRKTQKTEIIDEKKPFKCNLFSWNKRKETRQERTTKKQGRKNQQENKNKQKKQETRETESEKGKVKKPRRKKGRHWEMNKITCFQGKNSVFAKDKTHKILRKVEGQQPQNTRAGFFLLSLWSPHGHVSSSYTLFIAKVSLILFFFFLSEFCFSSSWWLCFVFCFHFCLYCALCFWFCGFFFCIFFVWPKNQIKSQNIWNVHFDFQLSCLHPRIFTWPS